LSKFFYRITRVFRSPTAMSLAHRDIETAKRELLRHQAAADYHARMSEYCLAAIRRLNSFITQEQK
jgi:hypothetical protein